MTLKKRMNGRYAAALIALVVIALALGLTRGVSNAETICGQSEHTHTDACYDRVLACSSDEEGHEHTDACYQRVLTCGQSEHTHSASCYAPVETPEPTAEPTAEPTSEPTAAPTEAPEETDQPSETEQPTPSPAATDAPERTGEGSLPDIYAGVVVPWSGYAGESVLFELDYPDDALISAFSFTAMQGNEIVYTTDNLHRNITVRTKARGGVDTITCKLIVTDIYGRTATAENLVPLAIHAPEDMNAVDREMRQIELTGVWAEDLIALAQSQLGYRDSDVDYYIQPDRKELHWSRYGEHMGFPYEWWCASFISFCLDYTTAEEWEFPREISPSRWISKLKAQGYFAAEVNDEYEPEAGDLIFFDWEQDGTANHVGIYLGSYYDDYGRLRYRTLEGNNGRTVSYDSYDAGDGAICGWGRVNLAYEYHLKREAKSGKRVLRAEGVTAVYDKADAPENAELVVSTIKDGSATYEAFLDSAKALVEGGRSQIVSARFIKVAALSGGEALDAAGAAEVELASTESLIWFDASHAAHWAEGNGFTLEGNMVISVIEIAERPYEAGTLAAAQGDVKAVIDFDAEARLDSDDTLILALETITASEVAEVADEALTTRSRSMRRVFISLESGQQSEAPLTLTLTVAGSAGDDCYMMIGQAVIDGEYDAAQGAYTFTIVTSDLSYDMRVFTARTTTRPLSAAEKALYRMQAAVAKRAG